MLEHAFHGSRKYWSWLLFLSLVILAGVFFYLEQLGYGLGITGMGRDVSWGIYIAQYAFMDGVAASAVTVLLLFYLHDYKAFGKVTIFAEFLAIASVIMSMLFVLVDLGQPFRLLNIFLYPTFHSLMFWDVFSLGGYLLLNVIITRVMLDAVHKSIAPPKWIRIVIMVSILWAFSLPTISAMLFAGLAGRSLWFSALLAPRFLSAAFAAGPALLVLVLMVTKRVADFDPGDEAFGRLALIITYAMCVNFFFSLMETFTTLYSGVPDDLSHLQYLYFGLNGKAVLTPWMWLSVAFAVISLVLLLNPVTRNNHKYLFVTCVLVFVSIWIEKCFGVVIAGFIPNPFGHVTQYWPTVSEWMVSTGVWALGFFLITVFYKIALSIQREAEA